MNLYHAAMDIIVAPDSFKGSMTALEAARAMARGAITVLGNEVRVTCCPIADGGEGTVETILSATEGERHTTTVPGPLGVPVDATWGIITDPTLGRTAVLELASAAGLTLVEPDRRDPTTTSTFGLGKLIAHVLDHEPESILLGIGGSATHDGACGAAQALGVRFYDQDEKLIKDVITGGMLRQISRVDMSKRDGRLAKVRLAVACDVTNPPCGPTGAAHVYAEQKGADAEQIEVLDAALKHVIKVITAGDVEAFGDAMSLSGGGAAGGFGIGATLLLNASLESGIKRMLDAVGFDQKLKTATLCLTGEGRLDSQSASGKAVSGVLERCKKAGVPCHALAGCLGDGCEAMTEAGLASYRSISGDLDVEEAMRRGPELLEQATAALLGDLD